MTPDKPSSPTKIRPDTYSSERPLKILLAPVEIAHNSLHMKQGLAEYGVEVDIMNVLAKSHVQGQHNDAPSWILEGLNSCPIETVRKVARYYDLIYFQYGCSLLDWEYLGRPKLTNPYPDMEIIAEEGTPMAAAYWGSDIWDPVMFISTRLAAMGYEIEPGPESSRYKQARIDHMAQRTSFILSVEYNLHLFPKLVLGETTIDLDNWHFHERKFDGKRLKIAHMPSSRHKKNTDLVLEVIEILEELGVAEKLLIENVPHDQARRLLGKADLFIDQMTRGFGKSAVEAMALGLPSMARGNGLFKGQRGLSSVIAFRNKYELVGRIVHLHKNRELLREASVKGREYVEKYHSIPVVAEQVYEYIKKAVKREPIKHLETTRQEREKAFQTRFYEQALPILFGQGDIQRVCVTIASGINNGVSVDYCHGWLKELQRRGLVSVS